MKIFSAFFCIIICVFIYPGSLEAATSEFTIRTFVGSDTTPPTTPTILSVVPVAATQINITWSASTDDVFVAGYRLFRDNIQIATTTLLSYSDSGLTASTTYSYTVDAFDSFGNISTSSLPQATTTLAVPPPTATTSATSSTGASGTRTNPSLLNLIITTTKTTAIFDWQTQNQSQYSLVWGRTSSYELGSVSGNIFKQNHTTTLDGLEAGTTYFYELRSTNPGGVTSVISSGQFFTESAATSLQLANVRGFTAQVENSNVRLSWQNTFTQNNFFVRVVRSHLFYPSSIDSGAVVYEGRAESFIDIGALSNRSPQYYTIFVLDGTSRVSSGAVVRADRLTVPGSMSSTTTFPSTNPAPADIGDDTILRAADISILQAENSFAWGSEIVLDAMDSYLVSIPYTTVPRNLKSIIVSVQNPTDQRVSSAYLLKLNQTGDAYTALVPGPGVVGRARMTIEVFDYEQETVRRIATNVEFVDRTEPTPFFPDLFFRYLGYFLVLLVMVGSWWWLILLARRKKRTPEDNSHDR